MRRMLAQELKYEFLDTDQLIEQRFKMTMHVIFADRGEKVFFGYGAEIAHELDEREGMVVSTGGGMLLNAGNVSPLSANGLLFCLIATPEEKTQELTTVFSFSPNNNGIASKQQRTAISAVLCTSLCLLLVLTDPASWQRYHLRHY